MIGVETRCSSGVMIRDYFPDLDSVAGSLFPTAKPDRVSIDQYGDALELQGRLTSPVQEALVKARKIREESRAVVYIAGGLTGVDEKTKERYGKTSDLLAGYGKVSGGDGKDLNTFFGYVPHLHGTDPVKHPKVTGKEVRDIDHLYAVVIADLHINFMHPLAHGNAIEFGWSEDHMIPTVHCNPKGNKLSRLVEGMDNTTQVLEYEDLNSDGFGQLEIFTDEHAAWLRTFPDRDPREFFYLSWNQLRTPMLAQYTPSIPGDTLIFSADNFLVYVKNPDNPRYGQVGKCGGYDRWFGKDFVDFEDGTEISHEDQRGDFSFWIK